MLRVNYTSIKIKFRDMHTVCHSSSISMSVLEKTANNIRMHIVLIAKTWKQHKYSSSIELIDCGVFIT